MLHAQLATPVSPVCWSTGGCFYLRFGDILNAALHLTCAARLKRWWQRLGATELVYDLAAGDSGNNPGTAEGCFPSRN